MDVALILMVLLLVAIIVTVIAGVKTVPQGHNFVITRLGKYRTTLQPGLNVIIPYLDIISRKVPVMDQTLEIPPQEVITRDNAVIRTNAIAFIQVHSPNKAVFGIDDYNRAVKNLVMTNLRAVIGEMDLDQALSSREVIKARVVEATKNDVEQWGLTIKGVEIQDINPSETMQAAMEGQAAAERSRRAAITKAEGEKRAAVLRAEGEKEAAEQGALAQVILAEATKQAMMLVQEGIGVHELPATYLLGEKYIAALQELGKSPNSKTLLLPADLPAAVRGVMGALK